MPADIVTTNNYTYYDNASKQLFKLCLRVACNRTEQNICLFRHLAYIGHSTNTNTAWKRREKRRNKT